ncbi:MAG: type III-B CRISPR-associated protein Cas10/Cmr2 [Kiritimatiellae bacterium]|nr:type III-B CRISPR-associated protein Cas10/Cmr2 [Kiritimatiellia bacterium]
MSDLWRRKLAAYLHDPPEKAYDYGPGHVERARIYAESLDVAQVWRRLIHSPDWNAAAADRFVFPDGTKLGKNLGAESVEYRHPAGGAKLPTAELRFPDAAEAQRAISDIRPEWKADDPWTTFLRVWRQWLPYAAEHAAGQLWGACLLPYLPADTRIPDSTIWHHNAIVSALEATREGDEPDALLRPAFFLFQVSPVQEFIAQARSTRDLWSGSYLLSWLMMQAIKAVADQFGPDSVIFPSLARQPLYDFLEPRTGWKPHENDVLVPGVPNRFLALVRADFDGNKVEKAFQDEWERIADACLKWLRDRGAPFDEEHKQRYDDQVRRHWHIAWQLWPWQSVPAALTQLKEIPRGNCSPLHLAERVAKAIPAQHRDERCYRDPNGELSPGWAWSAHYQLCQHALDGRRNVREFDGLPTEPQRKRALCDAYGGREEAVLEEDAIKEFRNAELQPLFRHAEPLGAANLIKRVWHAAYLARLAEVDGSRRNLSRAKESFDSVPAIAAADFVAQLFSQVASEGPLREKWLEFLRAASEARGDYPDAIAKFENVTEEAWLARTDYSIFHLEQWDEAIAKVGSEKPEAVKRLRAAQKCLRELQKAASASPFKYYAVLALDGDEMGKWLSGDKTLPVRELLAERARQYFEENLVDQELVAKWLKSPRPVSPSWHLQFSESLANFGLYAVRRIVEEVHYGQLIYSGGDDVLAMLPAGEALSCACDLRAAWQGRWEDMSERCRELFRKAPEGFIWLMKPKGGRECSNEPGWPLLVPGPRATVSVGIAIGHYSEPLQEMVRAAQAAGHRAKGPPEKGGWGRDAVSVTLFKRSGETLYWGTKFSASYTAGEAQRDGGRSAAWPLLEYLWRHYRTPWGEPKRRMPIGNRFPYRLAELLSRYGDVNLDADKMLEIAKKEVAHVIERQTLSDETASQNKFCRRELQQLCESYLKELANFASVRTGADEEAQQGVANSGGGRRSRPLKEFVGLFLVEAFIGRQAEERT